jgi:hypothetical protein
MDFSNMAIPEALEPQLIIMLRCESMIFMLIKEPVTNFSV